MKLCVVCMCTGRVSVHSLSCLLLWLGPRLCCECVCVRLGQGWAPALSDTDSVWQRLARSRQRCDHIDTREPGKRVLVDTDESALAGIEHKPNQRMDPHAATFFSFVLPYQVQAVSSVTSRWSSPSVTQTHWWLGALQIIKQGLWFLQRPCEFKGNSVAQPLLLCASSVVLLMFMTDHI